MELDDIWSALQRAHFFKVQLRLTGWNEIDILWCQSQSKVDWWVTADGWLVLSGV